MMELVSEAILFSTAAHDGMRRRKGEVPYVLHPLEAAAIVGSMTDDQEIIAAALLHDTVEDAGVTLDEIEQRFGRRVRMLVQSETEGKHEDLPPEESWRIRKEETLARLAASDSLDVMILWIGDKLSNMRAFYRDFRREGDAIWQKYHQKDPRVQAWYYRTILKLTERLSDHPAWIEYKKLTELVFGKED